MLLELWGCPGFGQDGANFLQYPGGGVTGTLMVFDTGGLSPTCKEKGFLST